MAPSRSPCDSCGAWLPSAGGRCPSCGHHNGPGEWARVGPVDGRRPGGDLRRRRGGRDAVVLLVIAVVGIGALVVAGSGDDGQAGPPPTTAAPPASERPPPTRRPTTTSSPSTSTSVPAAMVPAPLALGEPSGIALLVVADTQTFVADLDVGSRTPLDRQAGSFFPGTTMVARAGGVVVVTSGRARFLVPPYTDPGVELPGPREDGSIFASSHPDRVWMVQGTDSAPVVKEVAVDGTVTVPEFSLPEVSYPIGAAGEGVVVVLHGSMYVVGPDGATPLGAGEVLAAGGHTVVAVMCDEEARCSLYAIDVTSGDRRPVRAYDSDHFCCSWALSPDGSHMAGTGEAGLEIVDLAGGATRSVGFPVDGYYPGSPVSWSADGRFVFGSAGRSVFAYRLGDDDLQALFAASDAYSVVAVPAAAAG